MLAMGSGRAFTRAWTHFGHVRFYLVCLLNGHVFPRSRVIRVTEFPFDVIYTCKPEFSLYVLQWNSCSDGNDNCFGGFLDGEIL